MLTQLKNYSIFSLVNRIDYSVTYLYQIGLLKKFTPLPWTLIEKD